jgi:hypothetical protein
MALVPVALIIPLLLVVADSSPQLNVSPVSVAPGDTVVVRGAGFEPRMWVRIVLDDAPATSSVGRADRQGAFTVNLSVPITASLGQHQVRALESRAGGRAGPAKSSAGSSTAVLASVTILVELPHAAAASPTPPATPMPAASAPPEPTPSPPASSLGETPSPTPAPTESARPDPTPAPTPPPAVTPTPAPASSGPIRAAFYYPWFPNAWDQGGLSPYTRSEPVLGYYNSGDPAVIRQHIAWMRRGGIEAAIVSWWGIGHHTDSRVPALLAEDFRWTLYYEKEGNWDPPVGELTADLDYIAARYASQPAFLSIGGKPVLFVYGGDESCATADRWLEANRGRFYLVLKVWSDYRNCPSALHVDSWHQYSPGHRTMRIAGESFSVSAGFWKMHEAEPRLVRDLPAFQRAVEEMRAAGDPWQLVFFNEWGENSAIEPSTTWGTGYLDALGGSPHP